MIKLLLFNTNFNISQNLVAVCRDGRSNFVNSQGSGLFNRLRKILPNTVHVRDLYHAYHNIAEEACKLFPKYIVNFVKEACGSINRSIQKQIKYRGIFLKRPRRPRLLP